MGRSLIAVWAGLIVAAILASTPAEAKASRETCIKECKGAQSHCLQGNPSPVLSDRCRKGYVECEVRCKNKYP
jgi:hypothetical protein